MGEKNNIGKMYEIITQTDLLELAKSIGKTTVANSVERTASFVDDLNRIEEQVEVLPTSRMITREDHPEIFEQLEFYFNNKINDGLE